MSVFAKVTGSHASRLVWGIVALLLAAGLLVSMVMAGRALTDEKRAAEQRAEFLTSTVLFNALTPTVVSDVIFGPEYRSLIITVQGKILADSAIGPDAIAQVRIWRPDGTLIFSTAQRDKIGEFVARGNPQIEQALAGRTVSLLTDAQVAPKAGLQGSEERLYETFVPLHLPSQIGVLAAVQIDTRYAAITSAANHVWRPVEIGLLAGLVLGLALFAASFRRSRPAVATFGLTGGRPVADLAEADRRVRLAEKAAVGYEKAAGQYQEKLATSEQQLEDALAASHRLEDDAKDTTARIAALEAQIDGLREQAAKPTGKSGAEIEVGHLTAALKESELERERGMQEVRRMVGSVTALEAELVKAKASVAGGGAQSAKTAERIRVAEERATALEDEIAKTNELLSQTEAARATLEAETKKAEEARKSKDAKDKKAGGELTKTKLELQVVMSKLAEVQQFAQTSQDEYGRANAELEKVRASLAEREKTLAEREDAFAKTQETLGQRDAELNDLRGLLAAKDAEVAQAKAGGDAGATAAREQLAVAEARAGAAEAHAAEAETRAGAAETHAGAAETHAAETETRAGAAETRAAAAEAKVAELEASTARLSELEPRAGQVQELEARVRELEDARRKEVVELQTAQERLANSQAELVATTKRAKEAEAELKRVVSAATAAPTPAPAAREPGAYEEPTYEEPTTLAGRLSRLAHRQDEEPPVERPAEEPAEEPAEAEEPEAESLRTRLARAANARHRLSTPPGGSSG